MILSPQQQTVLDSFQSNHVSVDSCAGSGKTTTLISCVSAVPPDLRSDVIAVAFGRRNADELSARLPMWAVANTFHSFGKDAIQSAFGRQGAKVNKNKIWEILRSIDCNPFALSKNEQKSKLKEHSDAVRLVSLGKASLCSPSQYVSSLELEDDYSELIRQLADQAYNASRHFSTGIDFDDMIWFPSQYPEVADALPSASALFVDECQDLSGAQTFMVKKMLADGRLASFGDPHQCQPTGTQVLTPEGYRPIETLKKGSQIIGHHRSGPYVFRERKVEDIVIRPYSGRLIRITTSTGLSHEVTPEHRSLVKLKPIPIYFLYVMQKGQKVRIGICQNYRVLGGEAGFGLSVRLRQEQGDHAWILSTFSDQDQALAAEKAFGALFGISDMCFKQAGTQTTQQHVLDTAWAIIGDCTERLKVILNYFGRDIRFPFCTRNDNQHRGAGKFFVTQSCNLIPEIMTVLTKDNKQVDFTCDDINFTGEVVSLQVEPDPDSKRRTYVANGIVTHNSIYGFRGADGTALYDLADHVNATKLRLSVSFRCPKSVTAYAQQFVADITADPSAPDGTVETVDQIDYRWWANRYPTVICRFNAPLVDIALQLISRNIRAQIRGRSIGDGLLKLLDKLQNEHGITNYSLFRASYKSVAAEMCQNKSADRKKDIIDNFRIIDVLLRQSPDNLDRVRSTISSLFSDDTNSSSAVLSTIHRFKGLEDHHIIWLRAEGDNGPEQSEINCRYVACTRAKDRLTIVRPKQQED